jgi:anaerobic magnesium-protoporphyrin IX monomethyl ester cyclase
MKVLFLEPLTRWIRAYKARFSLAYPLLAAVLRQHGIEVKILDPHVENMGWKEIREAVQKEDPDIVAIGCNATSNAYRAIETIEFVKEINPKIITIGGGVFFSLVPEMSLAMCKALDFIVIGEGEYTLLELVKELGKKRPHLNTVKGIAYRNGEEIIKTPPRPLIQNLDELPSPAYDLVPIERVDSYWLKKPHREGATDYMMMITSRGCPWNCIFCTQWKHYGRNWRAFSAKRVVDEIEYLNREYAKSVFVFGDNEFNFDKQRVLDIAHDLRKRGIRIRYSMETRIDLLLRDKDILGDLVRSGLIHISLGMDSTASKEALLDARKGITLEQIRECGKLLREEFPEIIAQWFVVLGNRKDSKESIQGTVDFLLDEIGPDVANFFIMTPHPGTDLWDLAEKNGWIETRDFYKYDETHAIMPTENLSREEIEKVVFKCYDDFYRSPKLLKKLNSGYMYKREFVKAVGRKRWDEGGWDMPEFLKS